MFKLFLLAIMLTGCSPFEATTVEVCHNGFTYGVYYKSIFPIFNQYGMPLRCKEGKVEN